MSILAALQAKVDAVDSDVGDLLGQIGYNGGAAD